MDVLKISLVLVSLASSGLAIVEETKCLNCALVLCPKPVCKGGVLLPDPCKCCPTCAKVLGEECGGPKDRYGKCDQGLFCQRQSGAHKAGKCVSCPVIACKCPYGTIFFADKNGCRRCRCKPACKDPPVCPRICAPGHKTVVTKEADGCKRCDCKPCPAPLPACKISPCGDQKCKSHPQASCVADYCKDRCGVSRWFLKGKEVQCDCRALKCAPCTYGFKVDARGCPLCDCKPNPQMHNFKVVGTESYKCGGKKSFKRGDASVTRQDILTLAAFNPVQFFFAATSLALGIFLPDWFYNGGLASDSTLGISQSTKQVIRGCLIFAMISCLLAGILSFVYWFLLACRCKNVTYVSVCGTVAGVACVLTMVVIHVHVAISLSNVRLRKYAFAFSLFGTVLALLAAVGSSVTTGFSIRARKNAAREGHLSHRGSPPVRLVSPSPS